MRCARPRISRGSWGKVDPDFRLEMSFPPPTPKQARVIWAALTAMAGALIVALIAGGFWGLGQVVGLLSPVLWPLAVAGVLAYLLDPLVDFIERHGVPRARSILCVFALAAVIVLALFGSVVPQVVRETRQLAETIPRYAARMERQVQDWINNPPQILQRLLKYRPDAGSITNAPAPPDRDAVPTNAPAPS